GLSAARRRLLGLASRHRTVVMPHVSARRAPAVRARQAGQTAFHGPGAACGARDVDRAGVSQVVTCSDPLTVRSTATCLEELDGGLSGPGDPVRVPADTERRLKYLRTSAFSLVLVGMTGFEPATP